MKELKTYKLFVPSSATDLRKWCETYARNEHVGCLRQAVEWEGIVRVEEVKDGNIVQFQVWVPA
jgi:hypothetical protein